MEKYWRIFTFSFADGIGEENNTGIFLWKQVSSVFDRKSIYIFVCEPACIHTGTVS